jgi:D-sedoheptulose 7-phosphate isomerase
MAVSIAAQSGTRCVDFAREYVEGLQQCIESLDLGEVAEVIGYIEEAYDRGRQVLIIGNGGSAGAATHMAADLGKNILPEGHPDGARRLRALSLADNVAWITALANDLGYEHVFSEQIKNLVQEGDLVIAISGSGRSPNILEGMRAARRAGARVVALLGFDGGPAKDLADAHVLVCAHRYGHIEDLHMVLIHLVTSYFAHCNAGGGRV